MAGRVLLVLVALSLWPRGAVAHDLPPTALWVRADPNEPERLAAMTTFGLVVKGAGGARWSWLCPEAIGYDASWELPDALLFGDGNLVVGAFAGVKVSSQGCGWSAPSERYFRVLREGDAANHGIGLATNAVGGFLFEVELWQTADAGRSWRPLGSPPPADFLAFDVAPGGAGRLYLSGRDGAAGALEQALMRSDDGGATWQRFAIAAADPDQRTTLAAVDPTDADRLYVVTRRFLGSDDEDFHLRRSLDGGTTFETVVELDTPIPAVALSPDGSRLAIGGPEHGIALADTGSFVFEPLSPLRARCLTWVDSGLYACADPQADGFAIGVWRGEGFEPVMRLTDVCGPPGCSADSSVGAACGAAWDTERDELGATCEEPAVVVSLATTDSGCVLAGRDQPPGVGLLGVAVALALGRRRRVGIDRWGGVYPARPLRVGIGRRARS